MAGDDPLLRTAGSWTLPHPVWVAGSERTGERFENALGLAWRAPARSLRAELAGSRIRVFEVLPPVVDTGPVTGLDVE